MIIIDSREQQPFDFSIYGIEQKVCCIETGDYTFANHEGTVCIERKKSVEELAINFGSDWKRFRKELERMSGFEYKIIICEFPIEDIHTFPKGTKIPKHVQKYVKIKPAF